MSSNKANSFLNCFPDNYKIDGFIDEGGQGAVYKGTVDSTPAAIKVFAAHGDIRRIEREMDLLKSIECEKIVQVIDSTKITYEDTEYCIVAYQFLSGGDLHCLVGEPRVPEDTLIQIGLDVSIAIEKLWSERIVHRDIKPANIMRTAMNEDSFVLVDIGLARHLDRSSLTARGLSPGTPGFMSPEQIEGRRKLTITSDLFSLGVTLFQIATGELPFPRFHDFKTQIDIDLKSQRPDLSDDIINLIQDMLSVRAIRRPKNIVDQFTILKNR